MDVAGLLSVLGAWWGEKRLLFRKDLRRRFVYRDLWFVFFLNAQILVVVDEDWKTQEVLGEV